MPHAARIVTTVPSKSGKRNPSHRVENTSLGYSRYSNRRLGRRSYCMIKVGVEVSINTSSATANTPQTMLSLRHSGQPMRLANNGITSISGTSSRPSMIRSARTPCRKIVVRSVAAVTRLNCHTTRPSLDRDSTASPSRRINNTG